MLSQTDVFLSFSTNKLGESRDFYKTVLGLEVSFVEDKFLHVYPENSIPFVIYFKKDHRAADFTVLNFQVSNIESHVDRLVSLGVNFLQYPKPIQTDKKGISWDDEGSHIAWFQDPGGNVLALIEN